MAKLTTADIASFTQAAITTINSNFAAVETAMEKTLSRDGTSPNQMQADLDMNNQDILNADNVNAETVTTDALILAGQTITSAASVANFPTSPTRFVRLTSGGLPGVASQANSDALDLIGAVATPVALLADTSLTYTAGSQTTVAAGETFWVNNHRYEVAASGAADHHITTAGGVKLYVLPGPKGFNVQAFGAMPDGVTSQANLLTRLSNIWTLALAENVDIYFPAGLYELGDANFPFRQSGTPLSLLDCGGITICGDGPQSILATETPDGADVLQLNGLDNITIRDIGITTTLTGVAGSGCNGISITNGFDRIRILDVYIYNMQSVDKSGSGGGIDGGKAITFQPGTSVNTNGSAIIRAKVKNCSYGIGFDLDISTVATKNMIVDADVQAENCFAHTVVSGAAASGAIDNTTHFGIKVTGSAINCQRGVWLARAHGVKIDVQITSTKTAAAKRLDFNGTAYLATTTDVDALACAYAHQCQIRLTGDVGACDYKAQIGGATPGSSGLLGFTEQCDIYLDLRGTAATADVNEINAGGNTVRKCKITVTEATGTLPANFYLAARFNQITVLGSYGNNLLAGNIQFPATQIPSSDANVLDDYEEGTWTPILVDTTLTAEGATYSTNSGRYTKIGNKVFFEFAMVVTGLGTLTAGDAAAIIGLPYTSSATAIWGSAVPVWASNLNMAAAATFSGRIVQGVTRITLQKWSATETAGFANMLISDVSADGQIYMAGSYTVD